MKYINDTKITKKTNSGKHQFLVNIFHPIFSDFSLGKNLEKPIVFLMQVQFCFLLKGGVPAIYINSYI